MFQLGTDGGGEDATGGGSGETNAGAAALERLLVALSVGCGGAGADGAGADGADADGAGATGGESAPFALGGGALGKLWDAGRPSWAAAVR
jgi:hypothetical protein